MVERVRPEAASNVYLRQQTYELLCLVREPSVDEEDALKELGIKFLHVASKSYAQVVAEDLKYFWKGQLEYVNSRQSLKDYKLPVEMSVGINPKALALPDSFNKSQANQLKTIDEYSQTLQDEFPEFPDVRAVMLPVTAYAEADRAYKKITGMVLFTVYFARALDMLSEVNAARVGRFDPGLPLDVMDWSARDGASSVGAVPAVVFLRK